MPFDPKTYLKETETVEETASSGGTGGFDPKAYLSEESVAVEEPSPQTASQPKITQADLRKAERSLAPEAAALMAVPEALTMGYLDEARAKVENGIDTLFQLFTNRGSVYREGEDRYKTALKGQRETAEKSFKELDPTGLSRTTGNLAGQALLGAVLPGAAVTKAATVPKAVGGALLNIGRDTALSGLQGFGESDKETAKEAFEDAKNSAVWGFGLSTVLNGLGLGLKIGDKLITKGKGKQLIQIGEEELLPLATEDAQKAIARESNSIAPDLQKAVFESKSQVGQRIDDLANSVPDAKADLTTAFSKAFKKLDEIDPGSNTTLERIKTDAMKDLYQLKQQAIGDPQLGSLKQVPLKKALDIKRQLYHLFYDSPKYAGQDARAVQALGRKGTRGFVSAINDADRAIGGTGGQIAKQNMAYHELSQIKPQKITGTLLESGIDTANKTAERAYFDNLAGPYSRIPSSVRSELPALTDLVENRIPKLKTKIDLQNLILNRKQGGKDITNLFGLLPAARALGSQGLEALGRSGAAPALGAAGEAGVSLSRGAIPALGGSVVDQGNLGNEQLSPGLQEILGE